VWLDVHKNSITVAAADPGREKARLHFDLLDTQLRLHGFAAVACVRQAASKTCGAWPVLRFTASSIVDSTSPPLL